MDINLKINKKDDIVMKIIHYFVTKEDYKPVVVRGVENEIWLENLDKDYKLVRININYLHNKEQYRKDLLKTNIIMKKLKRKTFSLNMNVLNLLLDVNDDLDIYNDNKITSIKINKINDFKTDKNILEYYPDVTSIQTKKNTPMEFINLSEDMNMKTIEEERKFANLLRKNFPIVTYLLIAINIIMFGLMYIIGNGSTDVNTLLYFGANYAPLVEDGQVWRLITCAFLHIGIIHIFFNMYVLYIIGPEIEKAFGKLKFLYIYLFSALVGSLFSCLLTQNVSAGASGAIFGLFGSLLYFGYCYRNTLESYLRGQIIPLIVINLLLGFVIPNVDVSAHIGGLIGGVLASVAVALPGKTKKHERINGIIISLILVGFLSYMIFFVK